MSFTTLIETQMLVEQALKETGITHDPHQCSGILRDGEMLGTSDYPTSFYKNSGTIQCITDIGFVVESAPSVNQISRMLWLRNHYSDFVVEINTPQGILSEDFADKTTKEIVYFFCSHYPNMITEGKFLPAAATLAGIATMASVPASYDGNTVSIDDMENASLPSIEYIQDKEPAQKKMKPKQDLIKSNDPKIVMALTMWGEARSHGKFGMMAVGHVINNRAKMNKKMFGGNKIVDVAKKNKQFSCWNDNDPNIQKMNKIESYKDRFPLSYKRWQEALDLSEKILNGELPDPTNGATFYHTTEISPYWAPKMKKIKEIKNHVFYTLPSKNNAKS